MKDLFVYVADADAMAFMRAILKRPRALGTSQIAFDIDRHPMRDSGMVQNGAELVRSKKGKYRKILLMWDHHGSGRERRQTPDEVAIEIQARLDACSWSGNSIVSVLVPELEQWLWFCESTLADHCRVSISQLCHWQDEQAHKLGTTAEALKASQPKELFEHIMRVKLKQTISPRDFEEIGTRASITKLRDCDSFLRIATILRTWFPG